MVECELILEYVKRSVKKCVSINVLPDKCKKIIWEPGYCSARSRYRNINGSCNNLYHHDWGMADAAFLRWLTPDYTDDVSMPRQSVYGGSLPRVRELSNKLFSLKTLPNSNVTMMFTHFGLFIDHDMVKAGQTNGNITSCCEDDPKKPPVVGKCPGRREQHNHMTSFIDASDLYGPTEEESAKLRRHKRGHLRSSKVNATLFYHNWKILGVHVIPSTQITAVSLQPSQAMGHRLEQMIIKRRQLANTVGAVAYPIQCFDGVNCDGTGRCLIAILVPFWPFFKQCMVQID
ncbi:chorion peroxidase [Caerostris extrusa]|uniref:Chorion peroxidase n=1 Tax=Caerostris extrusa TaxID=172846 RepID=A0AAV4YCX2_CAEEX|nr:chorion peroxidase [Caerostris extrusa]